MATEGPLNVGHLEPSWAHQFLTNALPIPLSVHLIILVLP